MKIIVNKDKCPQNHPCPSVRVCPVDAIIQEGYKAPIIDYDKCIQCKKCITYCPMGAFEIEQ
ncbi:4Fe-4S binding protein [Lutibacter sp. B2]|nr:4Fe-4S binding protein [Lutibacter sp. B2]